jgi:hypothetical protein
VIENLVSDEDHIELVRLVEELAWRTDNGQADRVHELFVDDGVLQTGPEPLIGRDAINRWGAERSKSQTPTFHVCSGMRFVSTGDDSARGTTNIMMFSTNADTTPAVIGRDADTFTRTPDGWRFASRVWTTFATRAQ